ncbi:MAG: DUF1854 domain-containing protein [Armatimonadota bacterium]
MSEPVFSWSGIARLTAENTHIYEGEYSLLHCRVDDTLYRGVFAVRLFPIRHPGRFISLNYTTAEDKVKEIGVIDTLADFPEDVVQLVQQTLGKYYYEQQISRIFCVTLKHDLLFFNVQTDRGREEFIMPWRHDRAEEYDEHGKVLLDALDNRYIIPDVTALPEGDRKELIRFIYW